MRVRRTASAAVLAWLFITAASLLGVATPGALAANDTGSKDTSVKDTGLTVRIDDISPNRLQGDSDVSLRATVTNSGTSPWTSANAYLVIARTPFTTRTQVVQAIEGANSYTGERIVDLGSYAELGDIAPGQSLPFSIDVAHDKLKLLGTPGIYPVGVQIVATAADGSRSSDAVARATTFLPWIDPTKAATVPAGLIWTFTQTQSATAAGYAQLTASMAPDGVMRDQLSLAAQTAPESRTILLDTALLDTATNISERRDLPKGFHVSDEQARQARRFRDDLAGLARNSTTWVTGYGKPDLLALSRDKNGNRPALRRVIRRATTAATAAFGLTARQVNLPGMGGVDAQVLSTTSDPDVPFVVNSTSLTSWDRRLGSVVSAQTKSNGTSRPVDLLVSDPLPDVPGTETTATLQQRLLTEISLASMARTADPESRADAMTFVDTSWNPGPDQGGHALAEALAAWGIGQPSTPESLLSQAHATYTGPFASTSRTPTVSSAQLGASFDLAHLNHTYAELLDANTDQQRSLDAGVAASVSLRWRRHQTLGLSQTRARQRELQTKVFDAITLNGPPNVSLSGSSGSFPLTIANPTSRTIHVAVQFTSSNSAVQLAPTDAMAIAPRERRTIDVAIDVGNQASTTIGAQLVTRSGDPVGGAAEFNVRSTQVAMIVWVAMGIAAVALVLTLIHRFRRRPRAADGEPPVEDPAGAGA